MQFPYGVHFQLEVAGDTEITSILLVYRTNRHSCQPSAARQSMEFDPGLSVRLDWDWEWKRSGIVPPGAQVWWQWEITDESGHSLTTLKETIVVQDQRWAWSSISTDRLTTQWYSGDKTFGAAVHEIAVKSLDRISNEMGLQTVENIHITIYPTAEQVREALLVTTDWTGGVAFKDFNSLIIGVDSADLDWAKSIIPHEIIHLAIDALVFNCRGVALPTWLSEGLAETAEGPLEIEESEIVINALENDELPALNSLTQGFSAYDESARLSYAQSSMVVGYLLQEHGSEKMASLLAIVKEGNRIDSALEQVYGFDTQGLDDAWRASLGFSQPMYPPNQEATSTPTVIPTLPLMAIPVTQVIVTETRSATPEYNPPTSTPFSSPSTPTVMPSATPTNPSPTALGEADSRRPASPWPWAGIIAGLLLIPIVLLLRLMRRR